MIEDKNWLYKLGSDAENVERDAILQEIQKHMNIGNDEAASEEKDDSAASPETNLALAGKMDDDKLLLNSILDFNSAMYDAAGAAENIDDAAAERPRTADAAGLTFLETRLSRKPRQKKKNPTYSLNAIKYKPRKNPAVLNISTAAFQELLERHNMTPKGLGKSRSTSSLRLGSDGRATYSKEQQQQQMMMRLQEQRQLQQQQGVDQKGEIPGGVFSTEDLLNLDKEMLVALLLQERMANIATPTGSRPQSADPKLSSGASAAAAEVSGEAKGEKSSSAQLAAVPEEKEASVEETVTDPAVMALLERPSSKPPSRQKVVLEPIEIPTSPIKPSSRPASGERPGSGSGGLSLLAKKDGAADIDLMTASAPDAGSSLFMSPSGSEPKIAMTSALQTAVNRDGRTTPGDFAPTPRGTTPGQRPGTGLSKSASTSSLSDKRAQAAKKGGKGLEGLSVSSTMGTTGSLSKARLAETRSLRDYMMTVSGAFAMNVNPEASPSAQQEVAESIAVTKDMVKETVRKNRIDQTWTLFSTPGYYDAVGPEEIFKSDVNKNFIKDDKFDKAVKEADTALGIKTSPLRVWSENGIKNKIKIFQSGGALRT